MHELEAGTGKPSSREPRKMQMIGPCEFDQKWPGLLFALSPSPPVGPCLHEVTLYKSAVTDPRALNPLPRGWGLRVRRVGSNFLSRDPFHWDGWNVLLDVLGHGLRSLFSESAFRRNRCSGNASMLVPVEVGSDLRLIHWQWISLADKFKMITHF